MQAVAGVSNAHVQLAGSHAVCCQTSCAAALRLHELFWHLAVRACVCETLHQFDHDTKPHNFVRGSVAALDP